MSSGSFYFQPVFTIQPVITSATDHRMNRDSIPNYVRQFILERIESGAYLEALLLLRSKPNAHGGVRLWRTGSTSQKQTAELLARLDADGFVTRRGEDDLVYRYPAGYGSSTTDGRLFSRILRQASCSNYKPDSLQAQKQSSRVRPMLLDSEGTNE